MNFPSSPYIEQRDGGLYLSGTRVNLDLIVTWFEEHVAPERMVEQLPTLTLAQVYGAIAYYLDNHELIKQHISDIEREFERTVPPLSQANPHLFARLEAARQKTGLKRP